MQVRVAVRRCAVAVLVLAVWSAPAWAGTPAETRAAFQKLIERPRVEPAVQAEPVQAADEQGIVKESFTFASDAQTRVPVALFRKEKAEGRRPAVLLLHGTGSNKESNAAFARQFAQAGFIAVTLDGRYHGARTAGGPGSKGTAEYMPAIARAYVANAEPGATPARPFYWDTVWDVQRLVDVLSARPDVDAQRIGITGFSKGGIETYFAGASDERFAAVAPLIALQSFRWGLENNAWQKRLGTVKEAVAEAVKHDNATLDAAFAKKFLDRLVPGIYGEFDGPVLVTLIAPRPLLAVNGGDDPHTPVPGLLECDAAAKKAYAAAGAEERYELVIQDKVGHTVTDANRAKVLAFFVKWLKP